MYESRAMKIKVVFCFVLLLSILLCCVLSNDDCPKCGTMEIPYPLSTSETCGNSNYKLHCNNNGSLEFQSAMGFYYKVLSINQNASSLIISPPSIDKGACQSFDLSVGGFKIDQNSPFKISSSRNTIMLLNCSKGILRSPLNCSLNSPCRAFEEAVGAGRACRSMVCCSYLKESNMDLRRIRVSVGECNAYTSVIDFKDSDSVGAWRHGIELQWLPVN